MKFFAFLAAIWTVASAINPAAIYRSRCSEGASYWCESATQADECGAVEFCIQNFWRGKSVQESATCSDCEAFVNGVHNVLEQTSVQEEIIAGAKMACTVMGSLSGTCEAMVETMGPEVLKKLVSELNADEACHVLGFCKESMKDVQITPGDTGEVCEFCKELMSEVDTLLSNTTLQQEVENAILFLCPFLESFFPNCPQFVEDNFPKVIQFLLQYLNPQTCTEIGLCTSNAAVQDLYQRIINLKHGVGVDLCTACKSVVADIDSFLSNAAIQEAIILELDQVCYLLGPLTPVCKYLVGTYTKKIIEAAVSFLNPDSICSDIGFCTATLPKTPPKPGSDMCSDCTTFFQDIDGMLMNETVQGMIITEVELICDELGSFSAQCKSYVEQYATLVLELLANELSPQEVCQDIGFCPAELRSLLKVKTPPRLGDSCSDCTTLFQDIDGMLLNETVQGIITAELESVCDMLGSFSTQCKSYVDQYASLVYVFLASELDPQQVCQVMGFCQSKIFNLLKLRTPLRLGDSCSDCTTLFQDIDGMLLNETVQGIITAELESVCDMLGSFSTQCKSYVDQYASLVYEFLASELDPQQVCQAMGFCQSKIFNLLKLRKLHLGDDLCTDCETFFGDIVGMLQNKTIQGLIEAELDDLCSQLGSFADMCKDYVDTYAPLVFDFLAAQLSPDTVCTEIGFCLSTPRLKVKKFKADPDLCSDCKTFITDVVTDLSNKTLQEELLAEIEKFCTMAGDLEAECKLLVETYGPDAFQYLVSMLDPDTVCTDLGFCSADAAPLKINAVQLTQSTLFIQPMAVLSAAKPVAPTSNQMVRSDDCVLCKTIVGVVLQELKNNKTRNEIINTIAQLCEILPETSRQECKNYVTDYLYLIIEMLVSGETAEDICNMIGACTSTKKSVAKPMKDLKAVMSRLPVNDTPFCAVCQFVMQELDTILSSNKSKEEIKEEVKKVICADLPSPLNDQCDSFMDIYGDVLIQLLIDEFDPTTFCSDVGLCDATKLPVLEKKFVTEGECTFCKFIVSQVDNILEENATREEIKKALDKVCSLLPDTIQQDCISFVQQYEDILIQFILEESPEDLCKIMKLCPSTLRAAVDKFSVTDEMCTLCKIIVSQVDNILEENATRDEIKKALDMVCSLVPETIRQDCISFVQQYEDILIQLILEQSPENVCKIMDLCPRTLRAALGSLECDMCQTAVREFMDALQEPSITQEIVTIINETCGILPEDLKKTCYNDVDQYGDLVTEFIAQFFDPITTCTLLEVCPTPEKAPRKQLLGQHECTRGPGFWCASMDNAQHCNMVEHCTRHVWN